MERLLDGLHQGRGPCMHSDRVQGEVQCGVWRGGCGTVVKEQLEEGLVAPEIFAAVLRGRHQAWGASCCGRVGRSLQLLGEGCSDKSSGCFQVASERSRRERRGRRRGTRRRGCV